MQVSPSILNSDYLNLTESLEKLEAAGTDMLHIDVMDGQFAPNISFGVPVIKSIKEHTKLPLDIHLMIAGDTKASLEAFAEFAEYMTLHVEAGFDLEEKLKYIRSLGVKPCVSLNPKTDISEVYPYLPLVDMVLIMSVQPGFGAQKFIETTPDKIRALSAEIKRQNLNVEIEVDGGINEQTARLCAEAGATVLVAGSFLFNAPDIKSAVEGLKAL